MAEAGRKALQAGRLEDAEFSLRAAVEAAELAELPWTELDLALERLARCLLEQSRPTEALEFGLAGAQGNSLLRGTPVLEQMPATHNCSP